MSVCQSRRRNNKHTTSVVSKGGTLNERSKIGGYTQTKKRLFFVMNELQMEGAPKNLSWFADIFCRPQDKTTNTHFPFCLEIKYISLSGCNVISFCSCWNILIDWNETEWNVRFWTRGVVKRGGRNKKVWNSIQQIKLVSFKVESTGQTRIPSE